jgi:hypothetical protein
MCVGIACNLQAQKFTVDGILSQIHCFRVYNTVQQVPHVYLQSPLPAGSAQSA